jgi:hypothetical protein
MSRCGVFSQRLGRCPAFVEDKSPRLVIADVKIVLNAAFFLARQFDIGEKALANFLFLAGLRDNFRYYSEQSLGHGCFDGRTQGSIPDHRSPRDGIEGEAPLEFLEVDCEPETRPVGKRDCAVFLQRICTVSKFAERVVIRGLPLL